MKYGVIAIVLSLLGMCGCPEEDTTPRSTAFATLNTVGCPAVTVPVGQPVTIMIRGRNASGSSSKIRDLSVQPAINAVVSTPVRVDDNTFQLVVTPLAEGIVSVSYSATVFDPITNEPNTDEDSCSFNAARMDEPPPPDSGAPPFDVSGCPEGQDVAVGTDVTIKFTRKVGAESFNASLVPFAPNVDLISSDAVDGLNYTYRVLSEGEVRLEFRFTNDDGDEFTFVCTFNAVVPEASALPETASALLVRFEAQNNVSQLSRDVASLIKNSGPVEKVPSRVPQPAQEINLTGHTRAVLSSETTVRTLGNTDFPCGVGEFGFTVCPDSDLALSPQAGEWLFVFSVFDAPIPLDDPDRFYQYAFVFDRNASILDNFAAAAEFPNDYFQGTDTWFSAEYSPLTGWRLVVTDAALGGQTPVSSAARIIISGNVMLLVVPADEFPIPNPPYRATAFCHDGGFGLDGGFWSGDLEPKVGEPLQTFE